VVAAQTFEAAVQTTLNLAEDAFNFILPLQPAAQQAQDVATYQTYVAAANDLVATLNDAIAVAIQAGNSDPDLSVMTQAVSDAVTKLVAFVNTLQSQSVASSSKTAKSPIAFAEMNHAAATMLKFRGAAKLRTH
jgi:hypothetical protein